MQNETITYQGKIIEVIEWHVQIGEHERIFEKARRSPGSRTIVTAPTGKILLMREHRHEIDAYDYRLPGGKVFDKLTEFNDFLKTTADKEAELLAKAKLGAVQELKTEVGVVVTPEQLKPLYISRCGATVEWDLYYFTCQVDSEELSSQELEIGEDITAQWYTRAEARKRALDPNSMAEDRSVAVLLRFLEKQS